MGLDCETKITHDHNNKIWKEPVRQAYSFCQWHDRIWLWKQYTHPGFYHYPGNHCLQSSSQLPQFLNCCQLTSHQLTTASRHNDSQYLHHCPFSRLLSFHIDNHQSWSRNFTSKRPITYQLMHPIPTPLLLPKVCSPRFLVLQTAQFPKLSGSPFSLSHSTHCGKYWFQLHLLSQRPPLLTFSMLPTWMRG